MSKKLLSTTLFSAAILISSQATAEGFYVGIGAGYSDFDIKQSEIDAIAQDIDPSLSVDHFDETDSNYRLVIGYTINQYVALEGGYTYLGEPTFSITDGVDSLAVDLQTDGYELSLIGTLPVTPSFNLYGRVGAYDWETEVAVLGFRDTIKDTDVVYGVGMNYGLTDQVSIRAEFARYELDDLDIDNVNATLIYSF